MGLLNKLKNALFEEEYVEVEEKPKKIKKEKPKKEKKEEVEKPVAKKVILPGKKNVKVEELHEEELIDEDFEIRPKLDVDAREKELNEKVTFDDEDEEESKPSRVSREEFRMLNDDDFKVDDDINDVAYEEPEIVEVIGRRSNNFSDREEKSELREERHEVEVEDRDNYNFIDDNDTKPLYGMSDDSVRVPDYGLYEKKEEKGYFRPSPIISPIYGILDKNYRKEDVVAKKDVHVVSSYSRKRVDIDDVRNKAYGSLSDDIERELREERVNDRADDADLSFQVEEDDEKRLVDLTNDEDKPTVKEVTVGDAVEYFQDLGLEYNVDYVDATKENKVKRRSRVEENAKVAQEIEQANEQEGTSEEVQAAPEIVAQKEIEIEEAKEEKEEEKKEEKPVVKNTKKVVAVAKVETVEPVKDNDSDPLLDTSDNLFDLIDSMYQENE